MQRKFLIKREQNLYRRQQLNLKMNRGGISECHGRIQGDYLVFFPNKSILEETLVEEAQLQTFHRGVTLTMAKISDQYWIPTLRQLVKRIIKKCFACKRFNISRTNTNRQNKARLVIFIIGTDYVGSFICKTKGKILKFIYFCSPVA